MTTKEATKSAAAEAAATAHEGLKGLIRENFKIGEGGNIVPDKKFYEETLPIGLTMDTVRQVQKHDTNLALAITEVLAEVGTPYLKKHKDAERVQISFKAGADKVNFQFKRSAQIPDGNGGMQTRHGACNATWIKVGAANAGEMKKLRGGIYDRAAAALGGGK